MNIQEKIKKTSGILEKFVKAANVLCIIAIIIMFAAAIQLMLVGDIDLLVLNGNVILHSPFNMVGGKDIQVWEVIFNLIADSVELILIVQLLKQVKVIFSDISKEDTPFEFKHAERIRKIAIFFLIISFLSFEGGEAIAVGINFTGIIGAGVLWLISMIFEYGCELQQEHDETL